MRWIGAFLGLFMLGGGAVAVAEPALGENWHLRGRVLLEGEPSGARMALFRPGLGQSPKWAFGPWPAMEQPSKRHRAAARPVWGESPVPALGVQISLAHAARLPSFHLGAVYLADLPADEWFADLHDPSYVARTGRPQMRRMVGRGAASVSQFAMIAGMTFDIAGHGTFDFGYRYLSFLGLRAEASLHGLLPVGLHGRRADVHEIRAGLRYALQ